MALDVAYLPREHQALLKQCLRSCILTLIKKYRGQDIACGSTAPCVAHLPEEGQRFRKQRACRCIVAPHHGSIPERREGGRAAPAISQFPVQRQTLSTERLCLTEVVLQGCYPSSTHERFRSHG